MNVTHYDLFAGIGGFSYALDTIFNEYNIEHIFCEWEAFPTAVLKKHWPDATYYSDIAELVADTDKWASRPRIVPKPNEPSQLECSSDNSGIIILTGGFPCQPFSVAGRRQGTSDHRYKWPEMFAVIRNVRPDWIIAENVRGLVTWNDGMVLETVCADLESEGYEVQPFVIPACAVGAPHRRDRVWIVAHHDHPGRGASARNLSPGNGSSYRQERQHPQRRAGGQDRAPAHAGCERRMPGSDQIIRPPRSAPGLSDYQYADSAWDRDWREIAFATCHDRMDDGISRWMDGVAISSARHRRERLKACGNAIVPQVAMEIFRAINPC